MLYRTMSSYLVSTSTEKLRELVFENKTNLKNSFIVAKKSS